jgi:hypothetical protein
LSFHFYFFILCFSQTAHTTTGEPERLPRPTTPRFEVGLSGKSCRARACHMHLSCSSRCRQSPRKCHSLIQSSWAFFIHPMPALTLHVEELLLLWTGMCTVKTCRDGCRPRGKWLGKGAWVGRCEQSRIMELCEHTSSLACHDRVCEPTHTTPEHACADL